MTYQVLARKWRPRDFPSLVGQDHVVRALTHALDQQRLHHAYLFTGTRGVGKTTLSRILAKALNCETGITSQPCGVCRACREIDAGRFVDYVEMDAASNRGVDEMAALLERAIYAPVDARFKVYMIDEVHMLTNHAFNAMLKTLEEPPAHVKFILATTDPQKIPVTVLSRCLQFNLKQMPAGDIVTHLDKVLHAEGIDFEPQALRLLSRAADGSMRDALSLTDQAIAYAAGAVNEVAVRGMLGAIDQHYLMRLLDGIVAGDGAAVLAVADEMTSRSLSFSMALQDLAQLLNRIGWAQFAPASVLDEWPEAAEIRRFANSLSAEQVQLYYQIATIGRSELGLAPDEYAGFTMTLLRMLAFRPLTGASPIGGSGPQQLPVPAAPRASSAAPSAVSASAPRAAASTSTAATASAHSHASASAAPGAPARAAASMSDAPTAPARSTAPPLDASVSVMPAPVQPSGATATVLPARASAPTGMPSNGASRTGGKPAVESRAVPGPGATDQDDDAALLAAFGDPFDDPFGDTLGNIAAAPAAATRAPALPSRTPPSAAPDTPLMAGGQPSTPAAGDALPMPDGPGIRASLGAAATPPVMPVPLTTPPALSTERAVDDAPPARGSSPARAALEALGALRGGAAKTATSRVPATGGVRARAAVSGAAAASAAAAAAAAPGPAARGTRPETIARDGAGRANAASSAAANADDMPAWDTAPWEDDGAAAFLSSARPTSNGAADGGASVPASGAGPAGAGMRGAARADAPATTRGTAAARDAAAGFATAPPVPPSMPDAISLAGVGFEQDWPALAARLDVKGLAQQLAFQSELVALDGACLSLRIPMAQLASGPHVEKVIAALTETLGQAVELRIEIGKAERTAAAVDAARRAERQWRAEQSIRSDPFVQALLKEFDAAILPGSIQPLAAPLGTAAGAQSGGTAG